MESKTKKTGSHFFRSSFVLLVTTLIAAAIHYAYQFAMGRLLGPADYGIFAALFSIIYIVHAPVQAVQLTLTKFVAEFSAKNNFNAVRNMFFSATRIIFLISIVLFIACILLRNTIAGFLNINEPEIVFWFSFIFLGILIVAVARGVLQGMQKFKSLGTNLIIEAIIKITIGVALVLAGFRVVGALMGTNISLIIAFILAFAVSYKAVKQNTGEKLSKQEKSAVYSYTIPMLIALSTVTFMYSIDVILVKHFFPPQEAGIYSAAALVAKVIFFALMPISQAMFPKIAELKIKKESYSGIFLKSVFMVAGLSAIATAVYLLAPGFVLNLLFGPAYNAAIPLIGLFGLAISLLSVSYVFINYFLASGKTKFSYIMPAFAVVEAVLIWFWHASLFQTVSIIAVTMGAMLLASMANFFFIREKTSV